ncbi:carotenoid biosynthesis protein [Arthrobacter sp. B1805]|uniref:carotenoid biosynthesis protein n=1 Tax=Arthrobacter sp. B1805 TaxID=2058892 RepID=UPI0015E393BC|nr:carotenoid biosynthesis protein [Arthrobacter sp. B1805]
MSRTTAPRKVPRLLIASCAFLFISGYFVVRFPDVEGASYASYAFNLLIALPAFIALVRQLGAVRGSAALVAVSLFGYLIEGLGVATGMPYGRFYYGDPLGPTILGLVPYLLPLSYVPLVIGAVAVVSGHGTTLRRIVLGGLLLVVIDGVLDPGAVSLGFWIWPDSGPYYGVPLSNYGGWLISGLIASALVTWIGGRRLTEVPLRPGLLDSLLVSMFLWLGVCIFSGLVFPAVLAAALIVLVGRRRLQLTRAATTARRDDDPVPAAPRS